MGKQDSRKNVSGYMSNGSFLNRSARPVTLVGIATLGVAGWMAASKVRNGQEKDKSSFLLTSSDWGRDARKSIEKIDLPTVDEAIDWVEDTASLISRGSQQAIELSGKARSVAGMLR